MSRRAGHKTSVAILGRKMQTELPWLGMESVEVEKKWGTGAIPHVGGGCI
jgi:hypothetical protein